MTTTNSRLYDAEVSHAIGLQRYSNGVVRRIIATLNRADSDLLAKVARAIERAPASFSAERLELILAGVRKINAAAYALVEKELTAELRTLVAYEAEFQQKIFLQVVPAPVLNAVPLVAVSVEQVAGAALARPFQGVLLKEALSKLSDDRAAAVRNAIRMGIVENETLDQIVRRIRGTKVLNYKDGLMETSRRNIEAIARTAISHTQNFTKQAFYEANSDIVAEWEFVAVLDGRTTVTCASLSGKTYPIGKGPMPPRHWNCRSVATPVTKSLRELGLDIDDFSPSTRASMDGQVAADLNYSDWLRGKPAAFQDEMLGKTRADIFREKGVGVDRLTNNKGEVYTLEQLRRMDASLFD